MYFEEVLFADPSHQVSGESNEFYTAINIAAPIDLFYAARFDLEWDCTLFQLMKEWTENYGGGRLYNGTSPNPGWTDATAVIISLMGDYITCLDPSQGRASVKVDWSDYHGIARDELGLNVTVPPKGPREGTIATIGWRTYQDIDFKAGTTDIRIMPLRMLIGYKDEPLEYTYPVEMIWQNNSVTVAP